MGDFRPVPLPNGSYSDDSRSFTAQDLQNLIRVNAEAPGTRSPYILKSVPGLKEFAALNGISRQRGGYVAEGLLLVVFDQSLCRLGTDGSVTVVGAIPGIGRCSFAHNQRTNGNQVLIANGTQGFIYDTVSDDVTQITDSGFLGGLLAAFIGSRFVTLLPSRKGFQNSALVDGLEWNSTEFYSAESAPDPLRALAVCNNEVIVLGERTIDHFAYTGTTNALFEYIGGTTIQRGCGSSHAWAVLDNALLFLGNDRCFYEMRNYAAERISTHALEEQWGRYDISKAFCMTWEDQGHKVVYLTFTDGMTFGFDMATRKWHRRKSYGMKRWRPAWIQAWNNGWYCGEYNSGRVFQIVPNGDPKTEYPLEGADCIEVEMCGSALHKNGNRGVLHALKLEVEVGPSVEASSARTLGIGGNLPDCAVGDTVDFQYVTLGGASPVTYAITSGSLPAGLSMDSLGHVTGTTTTAEHDNSWTVTATDGLGLTADLDDIAYVLDMVGDPPDALNGDNYSYTLTGTEGTAPYTFALESGTLPTGATLATDGEIAGLLTEDGTFTFSVTITDDAGVTQTKTYNIGVSVDYGTIFVGSASVAGINVPFTIVDGNTDTVTATVLGSTQILFPSMSSDGARVYHYENTQLSYTKLSDNSLNVLSSGGGLWINGGPVLCDSTDTYLWALDFDNQFLRKIRIADGVLVNSYATVQNCTRMCWKDDTKTVLYVIPYTGDNLREFNTGTATWGAGHVGPGEGQQFGLCVSSATGYVYGTAITGVGGHLLTEYRPGLSYGTSTILPVDTYNGTAITPDGSKVYVYNTSTTGKVCVVDVATHSVLTTITVGNTPNFIAINAAGSRAYVSCQDATLWVIDTASDLVLDTITVGVVAHGVAILEGP